MKVLSQQEQLHVQGGGLISWIKKQFKNMQNLQGGVGVLVIAATGTALHYINKNRAP